MRRDCDDISLLAGDGMDSWRKECQGINRDFPKITVGTDNTVSKK